MLAAVEALNVTGMEMLVSVLPGEVGGGTDFSKSMGMGACQNKIAMGWVQEERPGRKMW